MKIIKTSGTTLTDINFVNYSTIDYEFTLPNGELVICRSDRHHNGEGFKQMEKIGNQLWDDGSDVSFAYSLDDKGGKILRDLRAF